MTTNPSAHSMKRLYAAFINTLNGLTHAAVNERAVRQEMALLAIALPIGVFIAPNVAWYAALIGSLLIVLAVELLNTAIEKLADHVTPERHPAIGMIKDYGSAAVFCVLCLAGLIWIAAFALRFGLL